MISRPRLSMPGASTTRPASARSSGSGQIVVGSVTVPVKAYAAIASPSNSALHLIHRDCGQPIAQPRTCPTNGSVTTDDIAKVFRFAPGNDVLLSRSRRVLSLRSGLRPTLRLNTRTKYHPILSQRLVLKSGGGQSVAIWRAKDYYKVLADQPLSVLDRETLCPPRSGLVAKDREYLNNPQKRDNIHRVPSIY